MFAMLSAVNARPEIFSRVTTADLWTDPHISARMLEYHLDPDVDISSYRREFVDRSVAWTTDRFGLGPGRRVADFGCGPGLYTNRLAGSGAAVTGIDLSSRSLRHARATSGNPAVPVRYLNESYLTYAEETTYDLIIMIMRDFGALTPPDRSRLLDVVRDRLAPGGAFFFDVDSMAAFDAVTEKAVYAPSLLDGFFSPRPYFGFHNTYRYEPERVSLDKFEIVEEDGARSHLVWIQYYSPDTLATELTTAGFEVTELLGDVAGAPYDADARQFAVVATVQERA
ncbi:MAG: methyltransferase 25 protein [Actinomycetota bacterium]|nr:methyltransferase 25 protein [Actinomycetota bacterium]